MMVVENKLKLHLLIMALFLSSQMAKALTIDEYIELAKQKNPVLKAHQESVAAAEAKLSAAEIDLSPVLTAGYLDSTDQSKPSQLGVKRETQIYNLGLAKKFQTGTALDSCMHCSLKKLERSN